MLVRANRSQLVDNLASAVGVSHGTCYKILTDDLNMSHVTQHTVQRILLQDQYDDHMMIWGDLISADDDPTFLKRIITGHKNGASLRSATKTTIYHLGKCQYHHDRENLDKTGQ